MKKVLLSLIALLGVSTYALADEVTVADAEIRQGGTGNVEVKFDITSDKLYRDFSFYLELPEGISFVDATMGNACTRYHSIVPGMQIVCNGTAGYGTDSKLLCLSSGVLANVTLKAEADIAIGTELNASIYTLEISDNDGKAAIRIEKIPYKIRIVENVLVLNETSTTIPETFEGKVRVKRTIKANEWSTLCLPFDMTTEQVYAAFGNDVKLAYLNTDKAYEIEKDGDNITNVTINFELDDLSEDFTGNYPYLIKTSKDITEFEVEANVSPDDVKETWSQGKGNSKKQVDFIGTYQAETIVPENNLFLNSDKFYYSTGKTKMKAFRCYFDILHVLTDKTVSASTSNVKMQFGVTTKIDGVNVVNTEGAVYTVDGKFVGRDVDQKKLQKGVYIIDGKKVAIK